MEIRVYANLRDVVGGRQITLPTADGDTVGSILRRLAEQCPGLAEAILLPGGHDLQPYVNVFLNGRSVKDLSGLATPVRASDSLAIFPPLAGGCP